MTDKAISRRERKKNETRARILKASRRLFEKKGVDGTSIKEIAEMADISTPTFFNYFANKDKLMLGIAEQEANDIFEYALELEDKKSSIEKIRLILIRLVEDCLNYLHLTGQILFSASICNTECPSAIYTKYSELWVSLIEEGQAAGEITDQYSKEYISISIRGCYYGVLFECFENNDTSNAMNNLENAFDLLFRGIAGENFPI